MSEAWAPPRSSSERGIAGLVRTLFAAEQRGALAAGPRPSVSPSQSRSPPQHTWSVRKVRKPTFQKPSSAPDKSANAPLVGKFVLMLQRIGTHRTSDPYRKKTVEDNFYYKAREVRLRVPPSKGRCRPGMSSGVLVGGSRLQSLVKHLDDLVSTHVGASHWTATNRLVHDHGGWFGLHTLSGAP